MYSEICSGTALVDQRIMFENKRVRRLDADSRRQQEKDSALNSAAADTILATYAISNISKAKPISLPDYKTRKVVA